MVPKDKTGFKYFTNQKYKSFVIFSDFINLLLIALDKWTHTESDGSSSFQRR